MNGTFGWRSKPETAVVVHCRIATVRPLSGALLELSTPATWSTAASRDAWIQEGVGVPVALPENSLAVQSGSRAGPMVAAMRTPASQGGSALDEPPLCIALLVQHQVGFLPLFIDLDAAPPGEHPAPQPWDVQVVGRRVAHRPGIQGPLAEARPHLQAGAAGAVSEPAPLQLRSREGWAALQTGGLRDVD